MPLLEQVLEQYPTQVKVVLKNFPLKSHAFARQAAIAALAAGEQGKYWEFHDRLLERFSQLDEEAVQDIAAGLALDLPRFEADRKSQAIWARVNQDVQQATEVGVRGTPTVFVAGRLLRQRSLEGFREMVDRALAKGTAGVPKP